MAVVTDDNILTVLKTDLGISASAYDQYLTNIISLATTAISREGIELIRGKDGWPNEDGMLIEMYSAYLYRKRREESANMPRSLRYALNNRLISQKGAINNG